MPDCPEPLRLALLDLLASTLLYVRCESRDIRFCRELADHVHNVPALLARFDPEGLRYYWEVERPCFLRALERIGRTAPDSLAEPWAVVEREYLRLCHPTGDVSA